MIYCSTRAVLAEAEPVPLERALFSHGLSLMVVIAPKIARELPQSSDDLWVIRTLFVLS